MTTTPRPLSPRSQAARDAFLARLTEHGATLLELTWLGATARHRATCSEGRTGRQGKETFYGPRALKWMLDLIDHHPAVRQASQGESGQLLPS